ncbi:hypothetical protein JCM11641_004331 [Rhodosporidiobolus odoratus]
MTVRKRFGAFLRKHFLPADPLPRSASTASSPSISRRSTNHGEIPTLRSHHAPSGISRADRPVTAQPAPRQSRRRRRRRTASPVGLPLYSKNPGEEEMSLFKSQVELTLSEYPSREEEEVGQEEDGESSIEDEGEGEEDDDFLAGLSSMRPSMDLSTDAGHSYRSTSRHHLSPVHLPTAADFSGNRPRSASAPIVTRLTSSLPLSATLPAQHPLSRYVSHSPGSSSPFASRSGLIDLPPNGLENTSPPASPSSPRDRSHPPVALRSTWGYSRGHRATHSTPINSLSPPSPSHSPTNSLGFGRARSSTLQRVLGSGSRNASNASLTPGEAGAGRSPYGQFGGPASGSTAQLASGSNVSLAQSLRGRDISAPLPNSFVHSSFIYPRSGPTPQQVAFISSREALGAYGYGSGVAEPPFASPPTFHAATSSVSLALPPGGTERPQGRGRSGSNASRMSNSSPLARVDSRTPPPSPPRRVAPLVMQRGPSPPPPPPLDVQDEEDEPKIISPPPVPAAASLASPPRNSSHPSPPRPARLSDAPSLTLDLDLPNLPRFSTPTPSPATPAAIPVSSLFARRASNAASPPPQIITLAPTPTASAAPSPLLPPAPSSANSEGQEHRPLTEPAYFHFPQTSAPSSPPFSDSSTDAASSSSDANSSSPPQRRSRELNFSMATTISEASFMTQGSWTTARRAPSVTDGAAGQEA